MHFSGNLSIQTARIKEKKKKNSLPQFQPRDLITNSFKMQFSVFERSLLAINCNCSTAPTLLSSPGWIFILGYFNHLFLDATLFYIIYFPFLGVNKKPLPPPLPSHCQVQNFFFFFSGPEIEQDTRWHKTIQGGDCTGVLPLKINAHVLSLFCGM